MEQDFQTLTWNINEMKIRTKWKMKNSGQILKLNKVLLFVLSFFNQNSDLFNQNCFSLKVMKWKNKPNNHFWVWNIEIKQMHFLRKTASKKERFNEILRLSFYGSNVVRIKYGPSQLNFEIKIKIKIAIEIGIGIEIKSESESKSNRNRNLNRNRN
jgi:hypothetical protein